MADGGEELLTGVIAGQLSQLAGVSFPIKIYEANVLVDGNGDYRRCVKVEMASGTYYVAVTDFDPHLPTHIIEESP